MSIREAIATASKEALGSYLAPELVEQLTDEIVHRASAELESALSAFAGFDIARSAAVRPPARKGAPMKRGRKPANSETDRGNRADASNGDGAGTPSHGHDEMSPENMI